MRLTYRALVLFDIDGTLVRRAGPHHREALVQGIRRVTGLDSTTEGIPVQGMLDPDILTIMMRRAGVPRAQIREALPDVQRAAERYYLRVCPPLHEKHCPGRRAGARKADAARDPAGAGHGQPDAHRLAQAGAGRPARAFPLRRIRRNGENARRPRRSSRSREARRKGWIERAAPVSLIGDAPQDIIAAREAGIRSISVRTGITPVEELIAERPDISLPNLRHLRLRMVE